MRCAKARVTARTAKGIAPRWKGRHVPCAINCPSARNSAVEKSSASFTTNDRAVRYTVRAISSANATSAFLISSSANGSRERDAASEASIAGDSTAIVIASLELDLDGVPVAESRATIRRHYRRAVEFLDQQRTGSPLGTDRTADAHRSFD